MTSNARKKITSSNTENIAKTTKRFFAADTRNSSEQEVEAACDEVDDMLVNLVPKTTEECIGLVKLTIASEHGFLDPPTLSILRNVVTFLQASSPQNIKIAA